MKNKSASLISDRWCFIYFYWFYRHCWFLRVNLVAINKIRFRIYQRDELNSHLTFISLFKWVLEGHRHDLFELFSWKTIFECLWENTICHNLRAQTSELDSAIPLNDCITSPYSKSKVFWRMRLELFETKLLFRNLPKVLTEKRAFYLSKTV